MSKKTKRYLMLLVAVGLIAVAAGGSGTFATFSAETANNGNFFATGTLFLHATSGGTTCTSEAATNNVNISNVGGGCNAIFQVSLTSGTATQYASLVLKNAGSVPADGINFYSPAPGCQSAPILLQNTTLSSNISTGVPITSLPVNALTSGFHRHTDEREVGTVIRQRQPLHGAAGGNRGDNVHADFRERRQVRVRQRVGQHLLVQHDTQPLHAAQHRNGAQPA